FRRWDDDGTLDRIHHKLYVECRELAEREAGPSAAIIDSQSVKSAEKGGVSIDPHGYDAGKKIKGQKRHVLVDTQGLLLARGRPHGGHAGSRRRRAADEHAVRSVPVSAEALRRWRLPGAAIPARHEAGLPADQRRDRQT